MKKGAKTKKIHETLYLIAGIIAIISVFITHFYFYGFLLAFVCFGAFLEVREDMSYFEE